MLVSDISVRFPAISRNESADQAQRIASPSNLQFFRFGDTELSLPNSRLTDRPRDSLISETDFYRSFDFSCELVKEGILEVCHQDPAPSTSKRTALLSPLMTSWMILHKSWKTENYLWKLYKASSSTTHHQRFKAYRSIFNSLSRNAKSQYYLRKFSEYGKYVWMWKTVQGEEDIQLELTSYFANIGKTSASSASSATSSCDFRAYLGPSCLKSMVLNSVSEFEGSYLVIVFRIRQNSYRGYTCHSASYSVTIG